ncbi:MAG: hypothetical protein IPH07_24180 [Deltaproteobacteria bacterium]|nr:hypothetical protein [Deltaproteobacteria bacterium]
MQTKFKAAAGLTIGDAKPGDVVVTGSHPYDVYLRVDPGVGKLEGIWAIAISGDGYLCDPGLPALRIITARDVILTEVGA